MFLEDSGYFREKSDTVEYPGRTYTAKIALIAVTTVLSGIVSQVTAQVYGTGQHSVTVQVSQITLVQVSAGTVNLNIAAGSAVAGQDQMSITDQTTNLLWGVNSSARKITVMTNLAAPHFTLKVQAVNPTQGTAAPQVTLSTTAQDFLTNIGRSTGTCALVYTGIALASQGTGNDAHLITFTVQSQ